MCGACSITPPAVRRSRTRASSTHVLPGQAESLNVSAFPQPLGFRKVRLSPHCKNAACCGQRIFVVRSEDYVYPVPFVEDEHTVLHPSAQSPRAGDPAVLKTIIPSRKATKQYLGEESDHED